MSQPRNEAGSPLPRMLPVMALVLIAGVILGVTFSRSKDSRAPSPVPAASQAPASVPSPAPKNSARLPYDPAAPRGNVGNGPQDTEEARLEAERKARAQHQGFVNRYSGESVDARWAGPKEAKMLAASKSDQIAQLNAEPDDLDVDCKTSMCRIQADFANRSLAEDWFTLFMLNIGDEMPGASFEYSVNPDGSARVTVYGVSRK